MSDLARHVLGELDCKTFLRDYWQKKPLLIRQAWPDFEPIVSAQELAGLSLEDDIESRLIVETRQENAASQWQLRCGPFTEDDYRQLPERDWTLLVQAVDHWLPDARDILDPFRFIPNWRLDDLMISYAVDGGNVGPHYDQYDVFLLQAQGLREWRIGQHCDGSTAILPDIPLKILQDFQQTERFVLEPGDMLYLPPGVAHYGIAQGECMTYSIGFRAPSRTELLQSLLDERLLDDNDDERYQDPDLTLRNSPSALNDDDIARIRKQLQPLLDDDNALVHTLGKLMTQPKYPELIAQPATHVEHNLSPWQDLVEYMREHAPSAPLLRLEHVRFAYREDNTGVHLFSAGQSRTFASNLAPWVRYLCNNSVYDVTTLDELANTCDAKQWLAQSVDIGWLYCDALDDSI